jgi:hypothetical protein
MAMVQNKVCWHQCRHQYMAVFAGLLLPSVVQQRSRGRGAGNMPRSELFTCALQMDHEMVKLVQCRL